MSKRGGKSQRVFRPGEPQNVERDAEIARLRRSGEMTFDEIGREYGISRERVRQIAQRSGVDPDDAKHTMYRKRYERSVDEAEDHVDAVLVRYIAGDDHREIARATGIPKSVVQELLDEHVTDEITQARSDNRMAELHPEVSGGPRDDYREERDDRYWTERRCLAALFDLAAQNGGRLISSTHYQQYAKGREDLPSFATVRNRVGRWSHVKVVIHKALADQGLS